MKLVSTYMHFSGPVVLGYNSYILGVSIKSPGATRADFGPISEINSVVIKLSLPFLIQRHIYLLLYIYMYSMSINL